jgi:hypothetical protein
VALLALSAAASASALAASAPRWKAGSSFLTQGQERAFTMLQTSTEFKFTSALINAKTTGPCFAAGNVAGSAAESPGTLTQIKLTCKNFKFEGSEAICTVHSPGKPAGTITSTALAGELVWLEKSGQRAGIKLKPASGEKLMVWEIEGASCPIEHTEPYKITGEVIAQLSPEATEVAEGTLELPSTPILSYWSNAATRVSTSISTKRLKIGKNAGTGGNITLAGVFGLELNNEEPYGVFAG